MTERRTLPELNAALIAIGEREGGEMWFGKPDRWYAAPHWRCVNDHVSTFYLKSEERGDLCLAGGCFEPVVLTFPEDRDGSLAAPSAPSPSSDPTEAGGGFQASSVSSLDVNVGGGDGEGTTTVMK